MKMNSDLFSLRIGTGYDVHKFCDGRPLIIGGVDIPHDKGLEGHSDADVLVHAIMDGLLGATSLGDIGLLFPDTDDAFKGANSIELLAKVARLIYDNNFQVINIDSVIIAQAPKMTPHRENMKNNIARALKVDPSLVGIKATTTEHLGFTGRCEGIAASAVCLVSKNN